MATETWGTGVDEFTLTYLDTPMPTTGSSAYFSEDFPDNVFSCWQDVNTNTFYTAGSDTNPNHIVQGVDTPIYWHYTVGSQWAYDYTPSATQNDGFFTKYGMRYRDGLGDEYVVSNVSDIQRLIWNPYITETTESVTLYGEEEPTSITYYVIDYVTAALMSVDIMKKSDPTDVLINAVISPTMLHNYDARLVHGYMNGNYKEYVTYFGNSVTRYNDTYSHDQNNADRLYPLFSPLPDLPSANNQTVWEYDDSGKFLMKFSYSSVSNDYAECRYYIADEDHLKFILAGFGLKFKYKGVVYKPIVQQGMVIGYTDDMDEESEWDDWHDFNDHEVPDTPPSPPPTPGYDDDPWHGATFAGTGVGGAGAFAKVYYMTSTELANLRSWMNSINVPEGFDPMQQIIGLSQVPVALSGSSPENVVFVNSSAVYDPGVTTRAVDTGVATQQSMGTPISYYLGSVDIVRRMQQRGEPYLDYDCQIELYLPLIGMFSLDTQAVMGRTIYAYAILDPVSGTLAAYAYVTKDGQNLPIAYGSTTIGVDLPISAQQLSVSRAALKQANAQLGTSLLSSTLSFIAAATAGGKGSGTGAKTATGSNNGLAAAGIREAGADYMKASQVGNVFGDFMQWGRTIRQLSYGNNTAIAGSFGGSTAQWAYPFTPYVKIIRPRFEKPSNYAHSQGVPCVQTKTIGSCTGFIQCIGVDVSGISGATDLELQAIQAALSNGIYAGGGQ